MGWVSWEKVRGVWQSRRGVVDDDAGVVESAPRGMFPVMGAGPWRHARPVTPAFALYPVQAPATDRTASWTPRRCPRSEYCAHRGEHAGYCYTVGDGLRYYGGRVLDRRPETLGITPNPRRNP